MGNLKSSLRRMSSKKIYRSKKSKKDEKQKQPAVNDINEQQEEEEIGMDVDGDIKTYFNDDKDTHRIHDHYFIKKTSFQIRVFFSDQEKIKRRGQSFRSWVDIFTFFLD